MIRTVERALLGKDKSCGATQVLKSRKLIDWDDAQDDWRLTAKGEQARAQALQREAAASEPKQTTGPKAPAEPKHAVGASVEVAQQPVPEEKQDGHFVTARWRRTDDPITIAKRILGTLKHEQHGPDTSALMRVLEKFIAPAAA
jgi:hypothetical protein